ncbi:baseplate J/gp47 family protein [Bosea sp. TWI1241]|uniref:baseplate J/gp47 family protein n=1 Tax=Bosea sp. TWI1241 TaxID=3148904 RepID=UPI00320B986F
MPFSIRTPGEIAAQLRTAFDGALEGALARLWPNNVAISAKAYGGAVGGAYDHQDWIARQIFVHSCDDEVLEDHGADLELPIRQASAASGEVVATAAAAAAIARGTILTRADGRAYRLATDVFAAGPGEVALPVVALEAGSASVALPGVALALQGVPEITGAVVGASGLTGGADRESFAAYRARLKFFKAYRPGHARPSDYVIWASEVSGVSRVFVERRPFGPGTVRLYPLFDGIYENGIAPAGEIARVKSHLELVGASGVADIIVAAPEALPVDVTISGLSPNKIATRNAIEIEIVEMFARRARVAGIDPGHPAMPFLATSQTFSRSWIGQAVANAAGEDRHVLVEPGSDVAVAAGRLPVPGALTFSG